MENVKVYDVGSYKELLKRSVPGDNIDIHHMTQSKPSKESIPNWKHGKGTCVALPKDKHKRYRCEFIRWSIYYE